MGDQGVGTLPPRAELALSEHDPEDSVIGFRGTVVTLLRGLSTPHAVLGDGTARSIGTTSRASIRVHLETAESFGGTQGFRVGEDHNSS